MKVEVFMIMTNFKVEELKTKVKTFGNSAHVTVPISWIGKTVKVTIVDEEEDD
jgi:putative transposon-encoded protein